MSLTFSDAAKLLNKLFPDRIGQWHSELTAHWSQFISGNPAEEDFHGWNKSERQIYEQGASAAELADTHLQVLAYSFFDKVQRRFGNQFDTMRFVGVELEFLRPISGQTIYDGVTRGWEADGRVELTGEVWHQNRLVQIRSVFVSHAFHQVRTI